MVCSDLKLFDFVKTRLSAELKTTLFCTNGVLSIISESLCWFSDKTREEFTAQFANRSHFVMFVEQPNQV